jgi:hypothetical protein
MTLNVYDEDIYIGNGLLIEFLKINIAIFMIVLMKHLAFIYNHL